jgi:hypothetical protein
MIVFSKERFLPTTPNVIVLTDKEGNYYYVHRDVYDMAIVLSDRHDLDSVKAIVEGTYNSDAVEYYYLTAPKPVNILAPFLSLVTGELENDIELLTGVIHAISGATNLREFVRLKRELRKTVTFSLNVKEEYEMAWDRFFNTAVPYDERAALGARMQMYAPMQQQQQYPVVQPIDSHSSLKLDGEPNRSKEAGAHETGDVVDDEDITKSPDWTMVAPGVYYNTITGDTAFVESDDILEADANALSPIAQEEDPRPTEGKTSTDDNDRQREALGLPIKRRLRG